MAASSSVILLANPAHRTALNARKRLIQCRFLQEEPELGFIGALLSIRHCAKESIIWDHRRWLLRQLYGLGAPGAILDDSSRVGTIPLASLQTEFNLVYNACEIYPCNYYAWSHWQFCMRTLHASIESTSLSSQCKRQRADSLTLELSRLRRWVELHVSDHSSVHHLCAFLRHLAVSSSITSHSVETDPTLAFDHALSLVTSYPSHESLWLYLRASMTLRSSTSGVEDIVSSFTLRGQTLPLLGYRTLGWWAYQVGLFCVRVWTTV
jgi:protein prenyltransferase alpha subunit repeat containing protein 1